MNIIVNAHLGAESGAAPGAAPSASGQPVISAFALRVRDAGAAYQRALQLGAWSVPVRVEPMELHIPALHGVGASRIYFVDRWKEFSIYDVDFVPIPSADTTVDRQPPAIAGLRWFGIVQYIGNERSEDWTQSYRELFGFDELPDEQRFGILPKGYVLRSPRGSLYLCS